MANGLNQCVFVGNLGADPEARMSNSAMMVLKLRLAVGERRKQGDGWVEHTEWVSVTCFGKRAEGLAKILSKGDRVCVVGKMRTSSYDDREGNKRYRTEIVADDVVLCGGRGGGGRGQSAPAPSGGGGGYSDEDYGQTADDLDDIPFISSCFSASERWW